MESTPFLQQVSSGSTREIKAAVDEAVAALERVVELTRPGSFEERERTVLLATNEVSRLCLERELQRIADTHTEEVLIDGRRYRRHQPGSGEYHSLCGTLQVARWTYRVVGERNGMTQVALELAAGLMGRATPALAFSVAQGYADMPLRSYEVHMRAAHRHVPSRSTLERVGKSMGGAVKQDVLTLEAIVRAEERLPAGAHAIALGIDRTTVPMAEERPPDQPPNSPRKPRRTPRCRRAPDPIDVCYRMAYVGTVSVVDENGDALVTRRYGATPEEGPDEMVGRMMADLTWLRRQKSLQVVVVQDGAPEMWNVMRPALQNAGIEAWTEVLDHFHATEHIAKVLEVLEPNDERRKLAYVEWTTILDSDDTGIELLEAWMNSVADYAPRKYKEISQHRSYLTSHARLMRYASCRAAGLPIASGVTEGACKSLISGRFKRSGQRWQQDGLTAALTLRALHQSDRLHRAWPRFTRRYRAEVNAVA